MERKEDKGWREQLFEDLAKYQSTEKERGLYSTATEKHTQGRKSKINVQRDCPSSEPNSSRNQIR